MVVPVQADIALDLLRWSATQMPLSQHQCAHLLERGTPALDWLQSRNIDSLFYFATGASHVSQNMYDRVFEVQYRALLDLIPHFQRRGCKALVFKGVEHLAARYNKRSIGWLCDIDILVPRPDLETVKSVLYQHGYCQSYFDRLRGTLVSRDVQDIATIESQHYELAPFCRLVEIEVDDAEREFVATTSEHSVHAVGSRVVVQVDIDVHFQLASDYDSPILWSRAVPSSVGVGETLCDADHLWFTLSRLYTEVALHGKRSLRDFAYVAPLLSQSNIDWTIILDANREIDLTPGLWYYLSFLNYLTGKVPDDVLAELHPLRHQRITDPGWQLGRLFDLVEDSFFDHPHYHAS